MDIAPIKVFIEVNIDLSELSYMKHRICTHESIKESVDEYCVMSPAIFCALFKFKSSGVTHFVKT